KTTKPPHQPLYSKHFDAYWKDGVVVCNYHKDRDITLEDAKEIVRLRMKHFGHEPYPGMVLSTPIMNVDKAGREYLFTHGLDRISAMGIVESDHICRIMLTAYLTIFKTAIPIKIFRQEEEARNWLKQFVK
ncbi:MAG: STAS/SEC14 domain-containing protein, partial [bacterium]